MRIRPLTTTMSSASRPAVTTRNAIDHRPERHVLRRGDVVACRRRRRTCAPARCRWRRPAPAAPRPAPNSASGSAPNMPGVSLPSAFANSARRRIVPDERSMALSTKSILPSWTKSFSSISFSAPARVLPRLAPPRARPDARREIAQVRRLIHGELEPDRIDRDDRREQRRGAARAAGDEIADRHAPVADAAGDRRLEFRELQVELRLLDGSRLGRDRRFSDALGLHALIVASAA